MSTLQLSPASTLVDVLRFRSEASPNRSAYIFLRDGSGSELACTYKELDLQARKIAAWLQRDGLCGDRVLLVYPQGIEYIAAFLGCLYAGSIAVPVYPPRLNRNLGRIVTVVKDCRPSIALTSRALFSKIQSAAEKEPEFASLLWYATEEIDSDIADRWMPRAIDEKSIAFLQYTSGSTAEPKGVMVSHGNLISNEKMIQHTFDVTEESVIVGWLPLYHDMGLIGNVLQSLWAGARCVLLSPTSFLRRPFNWLNAISQHQATISGGPNFAYDLCTTRITDEECATLDLKSWRIAFNGSEPVRAQTIAKFSKKFSRCGFKPNSFFPCYGLAEATLFVAGKTSDAPCSVAVCSESFTRHEFIVSNGSENNQVLMSSGSAGRDEKIIIVDPDTLRPCSPSRIGEIWISGKNVACGYWNQPKVSGTVFQAFTAQGNGTYLRTGDLGYLFEGELFITGRIKDLIILRGRNHYPQDLEFTVSQSHPAFANGLGAAFTVEIDGTARVILVQEAAITGKSANLNELLRTAVQAITEEHEIQMHLVALVQAGSLPRTSSGKIRRQECRSQFLNSELKLLAATRVPEAALSDSYASMQDSAGQPPVDQDGASIEEALVAITADLLNLPATDIDLLTPLTVYGLDSLQIAELSSRVTDTWNVELPLEELVDAPTINSIAASLRSRLGRDVRQENRFLRTGTDGEEWPLSYGQRALFYLYRLAPNAAAYHIPLALRIQGPLDEAALQRATDALVHRHECLRSVFTSGANGMVQRLAALPSMPFHLQAAEDWEDQQLQAQLAREASHAFDLEQGPLFRVALFRRSEDEHVLLLVFHHIICDFASLTILFEEFRHLYADCRKGLQSKLPSWQFRYADFVRWQQEMLEGERGQKLKEYWKKQLDGELPVLRLPTDCARPAVQTYRGAAFNIRVDPITASGIHRLGRDQEVSSYTVLLAAFTVLLHRYTSQRGIVLGSPVSGRTRSCWSKLPGYLINQIVFRAQVSGNESFGRFLTQMRRLVTGGLAHQDYPLALVAENLRLERDPAYPAVFQVMFSLQKSAPGRDETLVALALGEPGWQLAFDNVRIEAFAFKHEATQLDLTLAMAQIEEEFVASFQYNADLFDPSTVSRMAGHFHALLQDIAARSECRLDELRLMSSGEQKQLISDWNATERTYPHDSQIQDLFSCQAWQQGASIAVIAGSEEMTYVELEQKSNQLARHLLSKGTDPGSIVGLCMERCTSLLVGILGILKTGAAYLPIDPLFPDERIAYMLSDAGVRTVISQQGCASCLQTQGREVIRLDSNISLDRESVEPVGLLGNSDHLAYLMYTSGSTGKPKGVMVTHRSVINFFYAMDERISCTPQDTLLAVTGITFDISVLELLWTLTRGAKVVLADPLIMLTNAVPEQKSPSELDYSLFYFASANEQAAGNKYDLLLEGTKYADKNGLAAVWTPERHFHPFGGLFPNPSVTGAALATITQRIQIRAGSVVLPLHNVVRVAEEWSVVDNLSGGRTGLAFASGWHADDFVFAPENYANRKELTFQAIETFLKLWRGEAVAMQSGSGKHIEIRVFPKPIQERPSLWITASGAPDTFVRAGQIGAHVLTHLLGQSVEDVGEKVRLYRDSLREHGHNPEEGKVTLMLHTFLGDDLGKIKDQVRGPFTRYLKSSVDLIKNLAKSANLPLNFEEMSPKDMDDLLAFAFERYFETSALFGTVKSCESMIEKLKSVGVNEVACLIDFGVENQAALASLNYVTALKRAEKQPQRRAPRSVAELAKAYQPTLMQCTPAVMRIVSASTDGLAALRSLRALMLGGDSLPPSLAREIKETVGCRLVNMYGPTETTIWSSTAEVPAATNSIHIGKPIANTTMYILDRNTGVPVPGGVIGELYIGGDGVARGYCNRPALTAEKFLPDPFARMPGSRLYRTGDLARYLPEGNIELLGREDSQVKIRGVRIELGEIEAALAEHVGVAQTAVIAKKERNSDEKHLIAYIVPAQDETPAIADLRRFLRTKLQDTMVPSVYMFLAKLPLTSSGKVDRSLLPVPKTERTAIGFAVPTTEYETAVHTIWKRVLKMDMIGIDDNFFDLGGHSLRLVQVQGELSRGFHRDVPLVKLLEHPTIRALAVYLAAGPAEVTQHSGTTRAMQQQTAILRQQQMRAGT